MHKLQCVHACASPSAVKIRPVNESEMDEAEMDVQVQLRTVLELMHRRVATRPLPPTPPPLHKLHLKA